LPRPPNAARLAIIIANTKGYWKQSLCGPEAAAFSVGLAQMACQIRAFNRCKFATLGDSNQAEIGHAEPPSHNRVFTPISAAIFRPPSDHALSEEVRLGGEDDGLWLTGNLRGWDFVGGAHVSGQSGG
jgi:hypothetical protein